MRRSGRLNRSWLILSALGMVLICFAGHQATSIDSRTVHRGGVESPSASIRGRFIAQDIPQQNKPSGAECRQALTGRIQDASSHSRIFMAVRCGNSDMAMQILLRSRPMSAEIWSDLAAVYLNASDDPRQLGPALRAVEMAIATNNKMPQALFNRAQIVSDLSLVTEAVSSWQEYLGVEEDPIWRNFAQAQIRTLQLPSEAVVWESIRKDVLDGVVPSVAIARYAEKFPQQARLSAEEIFLEKWAIQLGERDYVGSRRMIEITDAIASALKKKNGDAMLSESIGVINGSRPGTVVVLASGHEKYAHGARLLKVGKPAQAFDFFKEARLDLHRGGSPFADWAAFQLALCFYLDSQYEKALDLLDELRVRAQAHSYLSLEGRVIWLRGTILIFTGKPAEALSLYQAAYEIFSGLEEVDNTSALATLLAKNYEILGYEVSAWKYRSEALRLIVKSGDVGRRRVGFAEAASAYAKLGEWQVGLLLQDESVRAAQMLGIPIALSAAFRQRASIFLELGLLRDAQKDLSRAEAEILRVDDLSLQEAAYNELAELQVKSYIKNDPQRALDVANRAIGRVLQFGDRLYLPGLYLLRHEANLRLGQTDHAEVDIREAFDAAESLREGVMNLEHRISYFDQMQDIMTSMVEFQVSIRDAPHSALDYVERGRARILAEWLAKAGADLRPLSTLPWNLKAIQSQIPPDTLVLEYVALENLGGVWIIGPKTFKFHQIPLTYSDARALARAFNEERATGIQTRRQFDALLERGFEKLFRPILGELDSAARLVVVPDDSLKGIPFSALRDHSVSRYIIQSHSVAVVPSLRVYHSSLRRARHLEGSPFSILAIGDPSIDPRLYPGLPVLPSARLEVASIVEDYEHGIALIGVDASRGNLVALSREYSVLHFAGHAVPNRENPFLAYLLLSSSEGDDGALYFKDLLGLELGDIKLVVLSACGTATEEEASSQEMLNLVFPFLALGVPSVVGSLWSVDDNTARLSMEAFHEEFRNGLAPMDALARVKRTWLSDPELPQSDPRLWSAFEVYGAGFP